MISYGWLVGCSLVKPGLEPENIFGLVVKNLFCKEINLRSTGKTRKLMIWTSWPADWLVSWLAGWRSLVKPGFGPGEVFGVSVKEFC